MTFPTNGSLITSVHNGRIKSLLRLRRRRERDATGTFLIEGFRELQRAVATVRLRIVYYCPDLWLGSNEAAVLAAAVASGAELVELGSAAFRRVSLRDRPDGLLGVGVQFPTTLDQLDPPAEPLLMVVEAVEKPGNLGAILRTADAAGVAATIVSDPATDPFNPNVVRASTGCLFTRPLIVATTAETLAWLGERDVTVVAATPAARQLYWHADLRGARAVVVGSERHGLSDVWLDAARERVRIPMAGVADSLNVAMAAGTILFESVRQRCGAHRFRTGSPNPEPAHT